MEDIGAYTNRMLTDYSSSTPVMEIDESTARKDASFETYGDILNNPRRELSDNLGVIPEYVLIFSSTNPHEINPNAKNHNKIVYRELESDIANIFNPNYEANFTNEDIIEFIKSDYQKLSDSFLNKNKDGAKKNLKVSLFYKVQDYGSVGYDSGAEELHSPIIREKANLKALLDTLVKQDPNRASYKSCQTEVKTQSSYLEECAEATQARIDGFGGKISFDEVMPDYKPKNLHKYLK